MPGKTLPACLLVLLFASYSAAADGFRFPERKHGQGELRYVNGIPVLVLAGSPEEIGEQMGVLALKPAAGTIGLFKEFLKRQGMDLLMPVLVKFGERQMAKWPEAYRREFEAMVKASGIERDLLVVGSTFSDLRYLAQQCSALMISPERSTTGGPLMGRNLDTPSIGGMGDFQMVIIVRAEGKKPFGVVSFPGAIVVGCRMSGFNADGLVTGGNDVLRSADDAPQVEWQNQPTGVVMRRILEECSTVAEAEALVRKHRPAERFALMTCDRQGGAVIEVTSKTVIRRTGSDGICVGTNHFQSTELGRPGDFCQRAFVLTQAFRQKQLSVADVAAKMHEANQEANTIHSFVFEPKTLRIHLAFGDGHKSATTFPMREVELGPVLRGK